MAKKRRTVPKSIPLQKRKEDSGGLNFSPSIWLNAFLRPVETFSSEENKESYSKSLLNYVVAGFIGGLFVLVSLLVLAGAFDPLAVPGFLLVVIISQIFYSAFSNVLLFAFSKIFSGLGTFKRQFYFNSLYIIPLDLLNGVVSFLLGFFNVDRNVSAIFLGLISLYMIYLTFQAQKSAHKTETWKTIIVVVVALIIEAFLLQLVQQVGNLASQ